MTYGISLWLPYTARARLLQEMQVIMGVEKAVEPYAFWSNVSPSLGFGIDFRIRDIDYASLRKLVAQWRLLLQIILAIFTRLLNGAEIMRTGLHGS
jgi:hypothetical protein